MKEVEIKEGTVKVFLGSIGALDRIYDSEKDLSLFLWRATRTDGPQGNPLNPDFSPRELRKGKFRAPDVTVETVQGADYIIPKAYKKRPDDIWKVQGTSLFDKPNTFQGKMWEYITIPAGTKIPPGLLIIRDDFNERFEATHYSIVPDHIMSVDSYKILLNQLLSNIESMKGRIANG